MIDLILRIFIKNYEDISNPDIREKYGSVASIISIICNLLLCIFKFIAGYLSHSVSIQADAMNNLSDAGSNIATLFGFRLSNKQPDSDHPYGHGRYEYITGLIIAFLILLVAFTSFKESVSKILNPVPMQFNIVTLLILIVSILVKLWMGYLNKSFGNKIDSTSLKAAGQDSINDCVSTFATIVCVIFAYFSDFSIDGLIGLLVSIFIFKAGFEVFNDTVGPLLGQAPDPKLIREIYEFVMSYPRVIGVHDMIIHDYGPSRLFITLHAEIRSDEDVLEAHDMIDAIEREMASRFKCLATIHMDPIDVSDEKTNQLRDKIAKLVTDLNPVYTIHDFRIVSGPTHTNLIFDVVLPANDRSDEVALKALISRKVKEIDNSYFTVIEIDHSYI